uniref:Uncharacterized protein n=1 Tax=Rhizophora mucronata TaxID=61149 RepID=A0A2P2PDB7_RHIMU
MDNWWGSGGFIFAFQFGNMINFRPFWSLLSVAYDIMWD